MRTGEGVRFLHRCLPYPAQCEIPGAEVEARVTRQKFLRTQDEQAILGPGGFEVLGFLSIYLVNTAGVEEQLEGPSCRLPVPVQAGV